VTRAEVRTIARDIIADLEHWYRTQAAALDKAVEVDADQLLARGVDADPSTTQEQRKAATLAAWQRVDVGRTRAAALRLVARVLGLVLRAMRGTPKHDPNAVPETRRQARVAMFVERQEEQAEPTGHRAPPAHGPGDLTKAWLVGHAAELTPELDICGDRGIEGVCGPCILDKDHTYDHCDAVSRRWKVEPNAT
jgi:hypothetical protein